MNRRQFLTTTALAVTTAEVGGGNRERCAEVLANMRRHLLGA
jgi:hypothetical protein